MKSLTKEELLNILKHTYVLLTEDHKPYGVHEIQDVTFSLTSDSGVLMEPDLKTGPCLSSIQKEKKTNSTY